MIHYHLPEGHAALEELDSYCAEWAKSRADATKDIIIAWAKARQGDLSALSGLLGKTLNVGTGAVSLEKPTPRGVEKQVEPRRPPSKNAQAVDLDL
jgi:hypothetical protein